MLKKLNMTALGFTLMLYAFGLPLAHTTEVFPLDEDSQTLQPLRAHSGRKGLHGNAKSPADQSVPANVFRDMRAAEFTSKEPHSMTSGIAEHVFKQVGKGKTTKDAGTRPEGVGNASAKNSQQVTAVARQTSLLEFMRRYRVRAGSALRITDFKRTPAQQARAIRKNLTAFGVAYVIGEYRQKRAIAEIVAAYHANRPRRQREIRAITRVIEAQVRRGVFISNHLLGMAVDFRSRGRYGARLSVLRQVARSMGARVVVERNHYHVDLA